MMVRLKASLWLLLFSIALLKGSFGSESSKVGAYVTLLYGDEFLLGVRVLGKSIRDTGSHKDMVALVSDGVSDYSNKLLKVSEITTSLALKILSASLVKKMWTLNSSNRLMDGK